MELPDRMTIGFSADRPRASSAEAICRLDVQQLRVGDLAASRALASRSAMNTRFGFGFSPMMQAVGDADADSRRVVPSGGDRWCRRRGARS